MTREEAIKIIKSATVYTPEEMEAIETIIPELREIEDERTKRMLNTITYKMSQHQPDIFTEEENEWFNAYLEKQKEEEGYEAIPVESTLEYKLGFKAGKESEKQKEQKPIKWSENDKQWLSEVYFAIDHSMYSEDERQAMKKYIDFLRSQSKPAEWSEEDEEMLEYIIGDVNDAKQLYTTQEAKDMADKEIAWLKSLCPSWKPSEEQMIALYNMIPFVKSECAPLEAVKPLESLYEDLKKL